MHVTITIIHIASTSTHGHFAFGAIRICSAHITVCIFYVCCDSNEIRAPIANPPNHAQLEGTPTILPSYIRVCAVVWECGERQTDTTDGCGRHTFRLGYASHEM